jgi:8-oxo-dGTP pyrophosphatase MutT (NUDIX family)
MTSATKLRGDSSHDHGPAAPTPHRARPRDAATLILVRRDGSAPRILMGRRHSGHDFMPDKWVFPGGRVDPCDFNAPYATDLRPDVAAKLHLAAAPRLGRALALAAVRETFEEAGLLLAKPLPTRPGIGPWRDFLAHGVEPDLAALDFVARAITPPHMPKRFDARFFMADAEHLVSLERLPDCGELDEIAWVDQEEALKLDLPSVTRYIVQDVMARIDEPGRPNPFMRVQRGVKTLTHL